MPRPFEFRCPATDEMCALDPERGAEILFEHLFAFFECPSCGHVHRLVVEYEEEAVAKAAA